MLKIQKLSKTFDDVQALNEISFTAEIGQIIGLVGQNGAGKSTLLRIIMRFISATTGKVYYRDEIVNHTLYEQIGFLPEERSLLVEYSIERQLLYFAKLHGIGKNQAMNQINKYLRLFDVKGNLQTRIKKLSKGNQQKVQIIAALIHNPELIILDEPFSGLDPVNAEVFLTNILRLKEAGKTIIFSSHNMANIKRLCDKVVMLKNGTQFLNANITTIKKQYGRLNLRLWSKREPSFFNQIQGVTIIDYNPITAIYQLKLANP